MSGSGDAIVVLDAGGEHDELVARLLSRSVRFVVRLARPRRLIQSPSGLRAFNTRGRHVLTSGELVLAAWPTEVDIVLSKRRGKRPRAIKVGLLTVLEISRKPNAVCWHLLTSEPISTLHGIASVVDAYRARTKVRLLPRAAEQECESVPGSVRRHRDFPTRREKQPLSV